MYYQSINQGARASAYRVEHVFVGGLPPDGLVGEGPDGRRHDEGEAEGLEEETARLVMVMVVVMIWWW